MSKSLALGNGHILVLLDKYGQVDDLFFPYIGLENQIGDGFLHKVGIWVDNSMHWLDNGQWEIKVTYYDNTMVSNILAINNQAQIELQINDAVSVDINVFIRKFTITNKAKNDREIKLFINQQYEIYESDRGDTAIYNHDQKVIIHYKGKRVFVSNCIANDLSFDDYSVGLLGIAGKEGTYKDAENDGKLAKNSVEHGRVDSVIGQTLNISADASSIVYYWISSAKSIDKALKINQKVLKETPENIIKSTKNYWKSWLLKESEPFKNVDSRLIDLYQKSLLIMNSHIDKNGSVIASGDYDLLKHGWGTYSYLWTRDGSFVMKSFNLAGYENQVKNFILLCSKIISSEGYMYHKYRADGTIGSSWHPWVRENKSELPIQEDETSLVLDLIYNYYQSTKDLEFIQEIYPTLILKSAEFITKYIDTNTFLPKPTYDLWEENFGIHCFTSCTVYSALKALAKLTYLLGKEEENNKYLELAEKMKKAIIEHFWNEETNFFNKTIYYKDNKKVINSTLDMSSIFGIVEYGILEADDYRIAKAIYQIENKLLLKTEIGGVCRYFDDNYFRVDKNLPGNPWIITTLWLAKLYLYSANSIEELDKVEKILFWVLEKANFGGILSEQINPYTGENISATPLIWCSSEYVYTLYLYGQKLKKLK